MEAQTTVNLLESCHSPVWSDTMRLFWNAQIRHQHSLHWETRPLRHLGESIETEIASLGRRRVANINPGTELLTAPATWSLLRCLKLLQSKRMRSLCVVDSDGRFQFPLSFSLVQRFLQVRCEEARRGFMVYFPSGRGLLGAEPKRWRILCPEPTMLCARSEGNQHRSSTDEIWGAVRMTQPPLLIVPQDLVQRLAHHHLHRVYVLSPTGVPTGIVTLSDVLLAIHRVHV